MLKNTTAHTTIIIVSIRLFSRTPGVTLIVRSGCAALLSMLVSAGHYITLKVQQSTLNSLCEVEHRAL